MTDNRYKQGSGTRPLEGSAGAWPGIFTTDGFDARCECTWARKFGVYQVKFRSTSCPVHGGPLEACLARIARLPR